MAARSTRQKILGAARKLFEREGAGAVSMRRVAEAVGITPMAIYRHFSNREALLKRISDDAFTEVAQEWLPHARHPDLMHGLLHSMENYLDYALQHRHLFDYSFSFAREDARRFPEDFRARLSPTLNVVADLLTEGIRRRLLREGDPWDFAMTLWAQAHGLIALYRAGRFSYDEVQFRAFYLQSFAVLFDGIKTTDIRLAAVSPQRDSDLPSRPAGGAAVAVAATGDIGRSGPDRAPKLRARRQRHKTLCCVSHGPGRDTPHGRANCACRGRRDASARRAKPSRTPAARFSSAPTWDT